MSIHLPSLAIVGTGKMGGAILEGLLQPHVSVPSLRVTTQSEASAELWRGRGVEARSLESGEDANEWAVANAELVVIAVKPYAVREMAKSVAHALLPHAVVVSVAAGTPTAAIESVVHHPVVRAMPNTPAQIGQGVTGVARGSRANADHLAVVAELFSLVGSVVEVDESQIDALSAISGSGPAYLFYVAEKLMEVAMELGFSADQATTLVQGTLAGAAALLDSSDDDPVTLRRAVTSPGGTTEQAIAVFDRQDMGAIFREGIHRAIARAAEIAEGR